jgi:hypothetical protein
MFACYISSNSVNTEFVWSITELIIIMESSLVETLIWILGFHFTFN